MSSRTAKVARRYARALFSSLQPSDYRVSVAYLEGIALACTPLVIAQYEHGDNHAKRSIKQAITASLQGAPKELVTLLELVCDSGRLIVAEDLAATFKQRVNEFLKLQKVTVTTAKEYSSVQKEAVVTKLAEVFKSRPEVTFETDAALMAGLTLRCGDSVIDASLATRIRELEAELVG